MSKFANSPTYFLKYFLHVDSDWYRGQDFACLLEAPGRRVAEIFPREQMTAICL